MGGSESNRDKEQEIKDYLSIIYGENIKVVFNTYVFTWEDIKSVGEYKSGHLLALNGSKVIKEKIEDIVEIKNGSSGEIDGYVVLLSGQTKELYKTCQKKYMGSAYSSNMMIISKGLTFEVGKIKYKSYSMSRPDLILTFNFKKYLGKFYADGELKEFVSHS